MKFTQGKWEALQDRGDYWIMDKHGGAIALLYTETEGSIGANARLISQAPAMYEALRKVRTNIGHIILTRSDATLVDEIDQVLAKIEEK